MQLARRHAEVLALMGLLTAVAVAFLYRLGSVVVSDMDEGTYLYAGKLVSQGLVPYRDFLLAHPPVLVLLAAAWQNVAGADIMSARLAYLGVVLVSTVPLYGLARQLAGSSLAGLCAVITYTTGMLLLANMGRTIRLEPIMNAFLVAAFGLYFLRPRGRMFGLVVGALMAAAVLVKLVAIVPVALLFIGELLLCARDRRFVGSWLTIIAGAVIVLAPAAGLLLTVPGFVEDVFVSQVARPGLPLSVRGYFVWQDVTRYPLIAIALLGAAWLLRRGTDTRVRSLAFVALGSTVVLVLAFRTFFGYYLVQALPWLAVIFAITCVNAARRASAAWRRPLAAGVLVLGVAIPFAYAEYYDRTARDHVSSPREIVSLLRQGTGYIYTMYPAFALWSGRAIYPWYYQADALVPRLTGALADSGFIEAFAGSDALVLYEGELAEYPSAAAYVRQHFTLAYGDPFYALWVKPSPQPAVNVSRTSRSLF
jgi:4-amino-4-deoxy-L-arabinose transferase-like glycosyltransferase